MARMRSGTWLLTLAAALCITSPARATWSIILVDRETREVVIGSCTCLLNLNLQRLSPVVLPERGAAAAQSIVDSSGANRLRIRNELLLGTDPQQILAILAQNDPQHQNRQYGIVDARGRAVTFSGSQTLAWAGGVIGEIGTIAYAIQGNILTGEGVVDAAELAVKTTPGDLPEKLMAAMEAARQMGGDGRCSCPGNPACGSPPPMPFTKSAHIGYVISARRGDPDGVCTSQGCARGPYFMNFNVSTSLADNVDPVLLMQEEYEVFRANLVGVTDQIASVIQFPRLLPPDSSFTWTMRVELRDWQGLPITGSPMVTVESDPRDGSGLVSVGPVSDLGGGLYECEIASSGTPGVDHIAVRVQDGAFDRYLMPGAPVRVQPRGDLNGDGVVSPGDIAAFVLALNDPKAFFVRYPEVVSDIVGDANGDGSLTVDDIPGFVQLLIGG